MNCNSIKQVGGEIGLDELKILQMDILQAIDEFCNENNIKYSMSNGTMLGAVRHKGYIPWDDDIDIYMLRDDYEVLMERFPKVYKNHFCISSLNRSDNWVMPFAKAYDNRTVVFEKADYDELYGVNIDIFPIDEVPNDESVWKKYDIHRRKLYNKYANLLVDAPFRCTPKGFVLWIYCGLPKLFLSRRKMAEKVDANSKLFRGSGYDRVFECCQGVFQKHPFRKSIFDSLVYYPFEDRFFKGFENYDEYLSNGFGNYMQLPPVEKRVSHHYYKAYWKE